MKAPLLVAALMLPAIASAQTITAHDHRIDIRDGKGELEVYAVDDAVLCLQYKPAAPTNSNVTPGVAVNGAPGVSFSLTFGPDHSNAPRLIQDKRTEIMDPRSPYYRVSDDQVDGTVLKGAEFRATANPDGSIEVTSDMGCPPLIVKASPEGISVTAPAGEHYYGMRGIGLGRKPDQPVSEGLFRDSGAAVSAGAQGDGGAPLAYTNQWGLFVDSVDGSFALSNQGSQSVLTFSKYSRKDIEAYLILGRPEESIRAANRLTGLPPMPPKWGLGFMNSQWGTSEKEVDDIIATYRQKQIPIDAFILDFDFKAWGEDNFGEWRWNSTNGPGNVDPDKYPDGASGEFGKSMLAQGIHLVGIMKPRILKENVDLKPTMAAAEATAHNWWMPNEKPYNDYFSGRPAGDLNFTDPTLRQWYWNHAEGLFNTGISGWWNDEADFGFDSLGFFHMQQSLYDGQRSVSNRRVWSINRNFYLGSQRFAFGTWSGDISTGFPSMRDQRARMLTLIDLGQSHWSMDSGGFNGHPSPENYARWLEFAATVPIMRVHNTLGEHRQPWVYGPIAEKAATKAIYFRYSLIPYLYSLEDEDSRSGIGIVRPLFWEFPEDPNCANIVDSWMMGPALLVSPVVEKGQTEKSFYLPPGKWFGYVDGKEYDGGQTITLPVDSETWSDLPVFVRSGSIVATEAPLQTTWQNPVSEITLDVWPDPNRVAHFNVYDDDGESYDYQHGAFFRQQVADRNGQITFYAPEGSFKTPLRNYRVRVHGSYSQATWNGKPLDTKTDNGALEAQIAAGKKGILEYR